MERNAGMQMGQGQVILFRCSCGIKWFGRGDGGRCCRRGQGRGRAIGGDPAPCAGVASGAHPGQTAVTLTATMAPGWREFRMRRDRAILVQGMWAPKVLPPHDDQAPPGM
eukprot:7928672-Pyramimonas_sp.AAC.1